MVELKAKYPPATTAASGKASLAMPLRMRSRQPEERTSKDVAAATKQAKTTAANGRRR